MSLGNAEVEALLETGAPLEKQVTGASLEELVGMIVPLEGLVEVLFNELVKAPLEELVEARETGAPLGELVRAPLEGLVQMGACLGKTLD